MQRYFNTEGRCRPAEHYMVWLQEYEEDRRTGMDIAAVSECIYAYTAGYPYLVSAICKFLDEEIPNRTGFDTAMDVWSREGIVEAVKLLLNENMPLFDSMVKQLDLYPDLRNMIEQILYQGRQVSFSPAVKSINLGMMFGFLKEENGHVVIANRVFEMYLLNLLDSGCEENGCDCRLYRGGRGVAD